MAVTLANARTDEQRRVMEESLEQGFCPFCEEYLPRVHKKPIREFTHWRLTENQYPYSSTAQHLLLILRQHKEGLAEVSPGAGAELFEIVRKISRKLDLNGGGLCIRWGDPELSGSSVNHVHAHIIIPKKGHSVLFHIGSKS